MNDTNEKKEVRLTSSAMVHAPGMVDYIHNMAKTDMRSAINILSTWDVSLRVAMQILNGDYTVVVVPSDRTVMLEIPKKRR